MARPDQQDASAQRQRSHTQIRDEHVFLDPRYDAPWYEERAFRRSYWEPTLRRLGMRYRPPYNTRHTYATMMLMAGNSAIQRRCSFARTRSGSTASRTRLK
jgi:integrase